MRMAMGTLRGHAHLLEQGRYPASVFLPPANHGASHQALGDDVAHQHARIHRRNRILKDDLHFRTPSAHLCAFEGGQFLAFEENLSAG